ncbi:MAG TPA: 50S ribosomal protein L4 [Methylomirabilota bacterium]|nr:50S ribosomal protein L4 [Methylomirabilota bacterium]
MKLTVKKLDGGTAGELDVTFPLVEAEKGNQAVHDVIVAYQAAQRSGTHSTKTMGEVAGSGKKPWRQKGTGRARAGSFASPLWRGGGVVFGPKPRDYTKKVSKTTKQLALRKAVTERLNAGDITIVDDIKLAAPKTKEFVNVLGKLDLTETKSILVVAPASDRSLVLAVGNVPYADVTTASDFNTYQALRFDKIVFTRDAFQKLNERLAK